MITYALTISLNLSPEIVEKVANLRATLFNEQGVFNASSTLFTMDFYPKLRPEASQAQLVWMGRVATTVMVLIGRAWIPVIWGGKGLYDYLQGVQIYLAPPIFVIFFLGLFNKKLNVKGALSALIVGFLLGFFRLIVDIPVKLSAGFSYLEGSFLWIINHILFQYFSILVLIVSMAVMVIVSYLTEEPDYRKITGLTYGTITEEHKRASRLSWKMMDVLASTVIILIILGVYLYFRG